MAKKIIRKANFNKRNKQFTVTIPKKAFRKDDSTLKFGEELFVKLEVVKRRNGNATTS